MNLGELIDRLSREEPSKIIYSGICRPHSYRGWYEMLAFEECGIGTVQESLDAAKSALGNVFIGWKGGEYLMTAETDVYIAERGCCGIEMDSQWLEEMLETGEEK